MYTQGLEELAATNFSSARSHKLTTNSVSADVLPDLGMSWQPLIRHQPTTSNHHLISAAFHGPTAPRPHCSSLSHLVWRGEVPQPAVVAVSVWLFDHLYAYPGIRITDGKNFQKTNIHEDGHVGRTSSIYLAHFSSSFGQLPESVPDHLLPAALQAAGAPAAFAWNWCGEWPTPWTTNRQMQGTKLPRLGTTTSSIDRSWHPVPLSFTSK